MTVLAVVIGTPIGILAGTYLAEYGRHDKLSSVVRFINDILLSAPSIVIGLFVYEIMVAPMGHFSGWAGAVALAVIVIPVVVRTTEDMLTLVPDTLREAAASLGLPRALMIMRIAYRAARAGIVTGILLAIARISGETAPLLFTALNNQFFSVNLNAADGQPAGGHLPVRAVALRGLAEARLDRRAPDHRRRAGAQHHRPIPYRCEEVVMSIASTNGHGLTTAVPVASHASDRHRRPAPRRSTIRNLDFFYGDNRALKGISLSLYANKAHGLHRPVGLRQVHAAARAEPHVRPLSRPARHRRGAVRRRQHAARRRRTSTCCAPASAWCSRSRRRSRCRSTRTSPSASGSTRRLPRAELDDRVELALRRAALWDEVKDKLNANGQSLSGGQQQRLCIARTVAVKPEVILFDEPCSALDPISTAKIEELIDELKQDYTIVIVTHNMQQAARVSDFTAFMYLGELIEFGADRDDLHHAQGQPHPGLHHRPLRLSERRNRTWPNIP